MKQFALSVVLFLFCAPVVAAIPAPPGTDIWIADVSMAEAPRAANIRNLTHRPGYDNQPAFVTENAFLFSSMDAAGQTDAWRFDINGGAEPLLTTEESEYSPTPAPDGAVSVVRVSMEGVQQLWLLQPGAEEYELLFPMLEGIGYHAWIDADRVALFMVREPSELHIADRRSGEVAILAKGVGRSLQPVPGHAAHLAFVERGHDDKPWIKQLDVDARKITSLAPVLEGSEDFAFLPDGRLVMAQGRALFVWNDAEWKEFARFDVLPGAITRLAVSPNGARLAMVVAEGE